MDITTTEITSDEGTLEITVTAGKRSYSVILCESGTVQVLCLNAAHKTWRGAGRSFQSFDDARDGYKSEAAKLAITEAEEAFEAYRAARKAKPTTGRELFTVQDAHNLVAIAKGQRRSCSTHLIMAGFVDWKDGAVILAPAFRAWCGTLDAGSLAPEHMLDEARSFWSGHA